MLHWIHITWNYCTVYAAFWFNLDRSHHAVDFHAQSCRLCWIIYSIYWILKPHFIKWVNLINFTMLVLADVAIIIHNPGASSFVPFSNWNASNKTCFLGNIVRIGHQFFSYVLTLEILQKVTAGSGIFNGFGSILRILFCGISCLSHPLWQNILKLRYENVNRWLTNIKIKFIPIYCNQLTPSNG